MSRQVSITVLDKGPLKISDATSVRYCGEPLETEGDIYLCRCGQSKNAPFCDGSHNTNGFTGETERTEAKDVHVWEGNTVRTFFNPNTCMHVFYCQPLKELRKRELEGDAAAAAEIIRVVKSCPSGALTYETKAEVAAPPAPTDQAEVEIMEGGEVRIQCAFDINTELPERLEGDRATLCRCGLSKNKPWCDGRHKARKDFR